VTAACDLDPFRVSDRTVVGSYYLNLSEWGSYYLCHELRDCSGHGVLEGTVKSIGWNARYILVWQNPDSGRAGWVLVDAQTDTIVGPLTDEQLASSAAAKEIKAVDVVEAWNILGGA
jgi:hypothetical protein